MLISLDTVRRDAVPPYCRQHCASAPNLAAVAAGAVVFTHAFAPFAHTLPSHMSMLTGRYPWSHGLTPPPSYRGEVPSLAARIPTLAEVLRAHGYRTFGVFSNVWLSPRFGFGRGFDRYVPVRWDIVFAHEINRAAIHLIREAAGSGQAWFVFLHYYDAHSDSDRDGNTLPYWSPPLWRPMGDPGHYCSKSGCATHFLLDLNRSPSEVPSSTVQQLRGLYLAGISALDAELGRLFDWLKTEGLYDDSLIVVTSDHGEQFAEHGRFLHSGVYNTDIAVPLFFKLPDSRAQNRVLEGPASTVDIMPTILGLVGIPCPRGVQGIDLFGDLKRSGQRIVFSGSDERYAILRGDWKLILDPESGRRELYHGTDALEKNDLSRRRPAVADRLVADLRREVLARKTERASPHRAPATPRLTESERERLRALGY